MHRLQMTYSTWVYGGLKHYALLGYDMHANSVEPNSAMNSHWKIHFSPMKATQCLLAYFCSFINTVLRDVPLDFPAAGKQVLPWALLLLQEEPTCPSSSPGPAASLHVGTLLALCGAGGQDSSPR